MNFKIITEIAFYSDIGLGLLIYYGKSARNVFEGDHRMILKQRDAAGDPLQSTARFIEV